MTVVKSTWDRLREAIENGRTEEALRLLDRAVNQAAARTDKMTSFVGMAVTRLARFDESELEKLYRQRFFPRAKAWLETTPGVKESVEKFIEIMESPNSTITVTEEPDRYVVSLDPCSTGGRLMRSLKDGTAGLDPKSVGRLKKAYPWTWSKSQVCCYCPHSSLFFEIIPIELRGYPIASIEHPEKPEDPCVFLFYKKPELIPEKYFTRVGKTKTIK